MVRRFLITALGLVLVLAPFSLRAEGGDSATVGGLVFYDANGNGTRDDGEDAMGSIEGELIKIQAVEAGSGRVVASATVLPKPPGVFGLIIPTSELEKELEIRLVNTLVADWEFTRPSRGIYGAERFQSGSVSTKNFGLRKIQAPQPATIVGTVFEDLDKNGAIEREERLRYEGWEVTARVAGTNRLIATARTAKDGAYRLTVPVEYLAAPVWVAVALPRPTSVATLPTLGQHMPEQLLSGVEYVKNFGVGEVPKLDSFQIASRMDLAESGALLARMRVEWSGTERSAATLGKVRCVLAKRSGPGSLAQESSFSFEPGTVQVGMRFAETELLPLGVPQEISLKLECSNPFGSAQREASVMVARAAGSVDGKDLPSPSASAHNQTARKSLTPVTLFCADD